MVSARGIGFSSFARYFRRAPLTFALALVASPSQAFDCGGLKGQPLGAGAATITDAVATAATSAQPEHCLVTVQINDSTLRFESRLPLSGWNGKLVMLGGGGFRGAMFKPELPFFSPSIRSERYATMATNGGYDYPTRDAGYFQAKFAFDPMKLADFTFLSEHRALPFGKELLRKVYGADPKRSFYEGCSSGGHDAMLLSQRFPQDFDGIVARAPAGNFVGLQLQFNRIAKAVRNKGGALNPAKQTLLANAVLAQCDAADGLADGIIAKPAACTFDASSLRCANGEDSSDACLSDAQIATVKAVTSPLATSDGAFSHPGYHFGGENHPKGWGEYIWPVAALGGQSVQAAFSDGFVRSFVTRDPSFDATTFEADKWLGSLSLVGAMYQAFDPDLSAYRRRGGKLILWNGTLDTSVSARDTARYYDQVAAKMGQAAANEVVELFLAAGVGHCFGGVGPDEVDLLAPLSTWVEGGAPPSAQSLLLTKRAAAGAPAMARPICKYPAYARYKGGDATSAASFVCTAE